MPQPVPPPPLFPLVPHLQPPPPVPAPILGVPPVQIANISTLPASVSDFELDRALFLLCCHFPILGQCHAYKVLLHRRVHYWWWWGEQHCCIEVFLKRLRFDIQHYFFCSSWLRNGSSLCSRSSYALCCINGLSVWTLFRFTRKKYLLFVTSDFCTVAAAEAHKRVASSWDDEVGFCILIYTNHFQHCDCIRWGEHWHSNASTTVFEPCW